MLIEDGFCDGRENNQEELVSESEKTNTRVVRLSK